MAFHLYCQIPFARTKRSTPEVIRLANRIGRTPSSVARKLGNLGSFDPTLAAQSISGLTNSSRLDRVVWDEFSDDWEALLAEVDRIAREEVFPAEALDLDASLGSTTSLKTEEIVTVRARRGQSFFRSAVLASYQVRCCFCGLDIADLLVAGHIIPWAERETLRLDPRNGLSLCAIHDRAYDVGHATVGPDLRIRLSSEVSTSSSSSVQHMLASLEGRRIESASRFAPKAEYLEWHVSHRFRG